MYVLNQAASPARRLTALGLILCIVGYLVPAGAYASTSGAPASVITGYVLLEDGLTGVPDVNVMASHTETNQVYASGRTDRVGAYTLQGLPAGTYDLRIQMPEGIYATQQRFEIAPGTRAVVSLALGPLEAEEGDEDDDEGDPEEGDEGTEEGEAEQPSEEGDEPPPEPEEMEKDKGGGIIDWMKRPIGAITTIVVSAIIIGAIANSAADDEEGDDVPPMTQGGSAP